MNEWWWGAVCAQIGPDLFEDGERVRQAKAVCERCPVIGACMEALFKEEAGLPRSEMNGVRAGMTPYQRHRLYGHLCPSCQGPRDGKGKGTRFCTVCQEAGLHKDAIYV